MRFHFSRFLWSVKRRGEFFSYVRKFGRRRISNSGGARRGRGFAFCIIPRTKGNRSVAIFTPRQGPFVFSSGRKTRGGEEVKSFEGWEAAKKGKRRREQIKSTFSRPDRLFSTDFGTARKLNSLEMINSRARHDNGRLHTRDLHLDGLKTPTKVARTEKNHSTNQRID